MTVAAKVTTSGFNVAKVRADFPILSRHVHGVPLVYLDSAASAQKPRQVIDAISRAYSHEYANVHRGLHYLANAATEAYEGAREKVAKFVNARRSEEIVFTRNVTEAINLVAQSWGRQHVGPGDEIIFTNLEHHANIVPWQQLAAEKGAHLRVIIAAGKFQGVITPTTPTGSRVISQSIAGRTDATFSPGMRSASPAKNLKM